MVSFDAQFEPTAEVQITDLGEGEASISWSSDAKVSISNRLKYFVLNYPCAEGRKCETFDSSLKVF